MSEPGSCPRTKGHQGQGSAALVLAPHRTHQGVSAPLHPHVQPDRSALQLSARGDARGCQHGLTEGMSSGKTLPPEVQLTLQEDPQVNNDPTPGLCP